MSVHHVGRGANARQFNIGGRFRTSSRSIHHSNRSRQDPQQNLESRRTGSQKEARSTTDKVDRYVRSDATTEQAGRSAESRESVRQEPSFRSHQTRSRGGDSITIRVEVSFPGSKDSGVEDATVEVTTKTDESPDQVKLNRRQSRRLSIMERRVDRMIERGHGDKAASRIERQIERAEAKIENGWMDADKGALYVDSLKEMLASVNDRLAPVTTEPSTDVAADEATDSKPATPYNELPENLQTWVQKFHSKVMGFDKLGNTDHAIAVLNERIEWARGKAEAGTMNVTNATNLAETLEHIVSRLETAANAKAEAASAGTVSGDASEASATPDASAADASLTVAESWDWELYTPEKAEPSERPFKDLPLNLKTWVTNYRAKAMDTFKAGNEDKAQGMIADRIAWVDERTEIGLMEPQTAANLKASLQNILNRMSEQSGSDQTGPAANGNSDRAAVAVTVHHRNEMYSYASAQYRFGA